MIWLGTLYSLAIQATIVMVDRKSFDQAGLIHNGMQTILSRISKNHESLQM